MSWGARSKFRNKPTVVDGKRFMSKLEAERYRQLVRMRDEGLIASFECQPKFELIAGIRYIADFKIWWLDGRISVEDVKGVETEAFKLKHKIWNSLYSEIYGPLQIIRQKDVKKCSSTT